MHEYMKRVARSAGVKVQQTGGRYLVTVPAPQFGPFCRMFELDGFERTGEARSYGCGSINLIVQVDS